MKSHRIAKASQYTNIIAEGDRPEDAFNYEDAAHIYGMIEDLKGLSYILVVGLAPALRS